MYDGETDELRAPAGAAGIDRGELKRLLPGLNALAEALLLERLSRDRAAPPVLTVARMAAHGLTRQDCSTLVDGGLLTAERPLGAGGRLAMTDAGLAVLQDAISIGRLRPFFDRTSRKLSVASQTVLQLPVQARNLTAFLGAIEDAHWAPRVETPLNGRLCAGDTHYVAVTAHRLTMHQTLIDFHADDGAATWNWRRAKMRTAARNGN